MLDDDSKNTTNNQWSKVSWNAVLRAPNKR
jgi:hypothetical protein